MGPNANAVSVDLNEQAPFAAILDLFDYLHAHPDDAAQLKAIYPRRGIFKTAGLHRKESDQKFTIDLSPARRSLIPAARTPTTAPSASSSRTARRVPVPSDATVILTGWCALILSGGRIRAARHRVRRTPGVRRLSVVLFVAPGTATKLQPLPGVQPIRPFSREIMQGHQDVEWFKEMMSKRWRYREGKEEMQPGDVAMAQDSEIEKLVWGGSLV